MASSNAPRKRISKSSPRPSGANAAKKKTAQKKPPVRPEVKIFVAAFALLVLLLSFYTPVFGIFGRFVRNFALAFFGFPGYIIPVYLIALFVNKCVKGSLRPYAKIYVCVAGIVVFLSAFLTIRASYGESGYITSFEDLVAGGISLTDGGIVGWLGMPVMRLFGYAGGEILLVFLMIVLLAAATNFVPIIYAVRFSSRLFSYIARKVREAREYEDEEEEEEEEPEEAEAENAEKQKRSLKEGAKKPSPKDKKDKKKKASDKDGGEDKKKTPSEPEVSFFIPMPDADKKKEQDFSDINIFDFESRTPTPSEREEEMRDAAEAKTTPSPKSGKKEDGEPILIEDEEINSDVIPYEFPPITLLEKNTDRAAQGGGTDLREQAKKLIETLHSFGVEARVLEVNKGPSVTRFEIQPNTGVKVSKIVGLADDIALNLAALSVRIEAPIPGKAAVGIEIPNAGNSIVRLREVIDSPEFKNFKSKTAFALGKDITGRPIVTDISKMPHALIAGATGSGKSVCINALITSILYKADPNEVKLIMIDPKAVELNVYNGIPHLLIPVVTDPRKAAGALSWAVQEMTKRYKMLSELNVRNINSYNEYAARNGEKQLEHIIIIVDELADLMMVAPHDVEDAICRLAQLARAAGMHLIVATQRPSVDVITGLIKANIPTRIAFAVSSQIDSRTILDMSGAEKLLGRGDMLFLPVGASKPMRVQGAFIDDDEVNRIVSFVSQSDKTYDEDVMEKIDSGAAGEKEKSGKDADEYLPRAIEVVVEAGQASASLLQSRLGVGYARARRLVDQLEERGIIGPYEGAKPRAVLISRAEYAEMMMNGGE